MTHCSNGSQRAALAVLSQLLMTAASWTPTSDAVSAMKPRARLAVTYG